MWFSRDLFRDVSRYCRLCNVCQQVNKKGNQKSPMVEMPFLAMLFESLAVDIVGPLPKCKRWCEVCADNIVFGYLMARCGTTSISNRKGSDGGTLTDL